MLPIRVGCGQDKYTMPAFFNGTCIVSGEEAQYFNARDVANTFRDVAKTGTKCLPSARASAS